MKIIAVVFAGLVISVLAAITIVQLLKVFIQEFTDLATEAWHSPEHHG